MARSLNKVQLIGNLTQDPEIRQTPSGQSVSSVTVATNRRWTGSSGETQEKAEFHNVVLWGKLAEIAGQYLRKGSKVYIEGRLETRSWEAQDGTKRYKTEIVAENLIMLDGKGSASSSGETNFLDEYAKMSEGSFSKGQGKTGHAQEEVLTLEADAPAAKSTAKKPLVAADQEQDKEGQINIDEIPF